MSTTIGAAIASRHGIRCHIKVEASLRGGPLREGFCITSQTISLFWGGDKGGRNWAVTKNHKESFFFFVVLCDRS